MFHDGLFAGRTADGQVLIDIAGRWRITCGPAFRMKIPQVKVAVRSHTASGVAEVSFAHAGMPFPAEDDAVASGIDPAGFGGKQKWDKAAAGHLRRRL